MFSRVLRRSLSGFIALMLILAYSGVVAGQPADAGKKHTLWRVSSKTNSVYILGSIHLLKQSDYPLDDVLEKAYENSRQLYLEINLDAVDDQKIQQLTIEKGTYPSVEALKSALSKQTYELTERRLAGLGLNIEQFDRLKPWLLATTISIAELEKLGYDPGHGVDRYFEGKARKDGKKVDGFETAEYQLNLLADLPTRMQEELLLQTLAELDDMESQIAAIVGAWKTGDTAALDDGMLKSFREYPDLYRTLLINRNKNWLPKIEALIGRNENVMIIVGAAHLTGKDGIIASLKQKGYKVEQL